MKNYPECNELTFPTLQETHQTQTQLMNQTVTLKQ